jgi:signal transduction histidine kinase
MGPLIVAALLLVLLAALATLQYRWLGQVSDAERDRLRATLDTRASAFVGDFDRAITRVYLAFQATPAQIESGDRVAALSEALARANAAGPALVKEVYEIDRSAPRPLGRFDAARGVLEPVEWPDALQGVRARLDHPGPEAQEKLPILLSDPIDPAVPALIVPIPRLQRLEAGGHLAVLPDPMGILHAIIVVLDADRLRDQLIEPLAARHFGEPASSEYDVTIARGPAAHDVVYTSAPDRADAARAPDVSVGMFNLRLNDLHFAVAGDNGAARPPAMEKFAITIVRQGTAMTLRQSTNGAPGGWRLSVRGRSGSLDALVAQSRRRNLAISLGILGLLGASVVLIIGSAQRQQRLARQQMAFVAAVSHELRTPLAVIRSAGENLADGVVADRQQVRRYGTLVESEGRRLSAMVERVMEFAGISSRVARHTMVDVDMHRVVADAVDGVGADARERNVRIDVRVDRTLPVVDGDADALRSAVQNLVGNAVKYSAPGGTVDVDVRAALGSITVRVIDRGLGIDAADLPHIDKPFFRGRRALDAQIRGSGVGLTIVRHIVDAHHGRLHVESRPGEGTAATMELPARAAASGLQASAAS